MLEIKNLKVSYRSNIGLVEAVRGVDLEIKKGECVGLVGESGCGKTSVGLSITKLIPEEKGIISSGSILLDGEDMLTLDKEALRKIRGRRISYVFQEAFSSLNPVFTIYQQLKEALRDKGNSEGAIAALLKSVGLENIIGRRKIYPHQLSGGMQQRVMIAMAIASKPELVIMDEPTTALDVTIQKQILDLIMELKDRMGLSILFISHDLKTVFNIARKIVVMYAGKVVEDACKEDIKKAPHHPYTMGLIDSMPSFEHRKKRFDAIEGRTPSFSNLPKGCKFHPRCKYRIDRCMKKEPELEDDLNTNHFARCVRAKEFASNGTIKNR